MRSLVALLSIASDTDAGKAITSCPAQCHHASVTNRPVTLADKIWTSCFNPPLNHVVQKAPVVDLPFGRPVFPWLLQSPHHVTCCGGDKSKEVTVPQDAPIQPGLQSRWDGWLHGCRRD